MNYVAIKMDVRCKKTGGIVQKKEGMLQRNGRKLKKEWIKVANVDEGCHKNGRMLRKNGRVMQKKKIDVG